MNNNLLEVATIGKAVGLSGQLKFYVESDFEMQFKKGSQFRLSNGSTVEIESYNPQKELIKFIGISDRENAAKLTNQKLYTTIEETQKNCILKEGEFFWFDLMGASVYDGELLLGVVEEIERIGAVDYLVVSTHEALIEKGHVKQFYIPYIDHYIGGFDKTVKKVDTKGGFLLLEAS